MSWSKYIFEFVGPYAGKERTSAFLEVGDDDNPSSSAALYEHAWPGVEKKYVCEVVSEDRLRALLTFRPVPGEPGCGLSGAKAIRIKTDIATDEERLRGAPYFQDTEEEVSWEHVAQILSGIPRTKKSAWLWKQFWFFDPFTHRDQAGLLWRTHAESNFYRVEREWRATRLLQAVGAAFAPVDWAAKKFGLWVDFNGSPGRFFRFPEKGNITQYFGQGKRTEWILQGQLWRIRLFRKVLET